MESGKLDTEQPTGMGGLDSQETEPAPPRWQFRILYTGFLGIVATEPQIWDGKQPLGLGRRTSSSNIGPWLHIADERASREHARVSMGTIGPVVEDLHSKYGTTLNGVQLRPGESQPLHDEDLLRLGDAFVFVRYEAEVADVPIPAVVGVSRTARLIRRALARCAFNNRSVLLLGESGTGKEVAAQTLHRLSQRRGRLVAINCAAVPDSLAEAQFFGTQPGAFTGAVEQAGCFAQAHEGTLFLDEVGDLPSLLQPKLLRAVETRQVTPLGGQQPIPCDVRIISATHRDLAASVRERTFRQDLYSRLSAEVLHLAPLRERREDILLLAQHFAGPGWRPSSRLVPALLTYGWPLNIRELGNFVGRLQEGNEAAELAWLQSPPTTAYSSGLRASAPSTPEVLPLPMPALSQGAKPRPWKTGDPVPSQEQVIALLTEHRGNLHEIERMFGASRRQFRRWAEEKYGLDIAHYRRGSNRPLDSAD
jgi:DNA-binding NtrC family response regulator